MDCEPGRTRAHARLTYILTGALHHFIEASEQNNKGKGKVSKSGDDLGVDSIVEDAQRLLLRAQAIAAYALRLDDNGNLIDRGPRTGVPPSAAEVECPQQHSCRPFLQIGKHEEALATMFTFNPPSHAPPSPPLTTEEVVTASSLRQPSQDSFSEACVWPARPPPTPTSMKAIRRKPVPSEITSRAATGDAVGLTPQPWFPSIPPGGGARKAAPPLPHLLPTSTTPEAVQSSHSTLCLPGLGEEETVVDPLTGLPAQRATGFEPGPSNRDPGPTRQIPFRHLPTRPPPTYQPQLMDTDSNDWWAARKLPALSPNSAVVTQMSAKINGIPTDDSNYSSLPSSSMPGAWSSRPPSYVEFEPDNAMEDNNTTHIKESEQTKTGTLKQFLKTMRCRSQKAPTRGDAALAQRLQHEEDQVSFTMGLNNPFADPIENTARDVSTMSDRLLAQRPQVIEEPVPRESLTQASCSSAIGERDLRQASAADGTAEMTALREEGGRSRARSKTTGQLQSRRREGHQGTTDQQTGKWVKGKGERFYHFETSPDSNAAVLANSLGKERMDADFRAARALQAELEEEARQEELRTLKDLQAKFEDEDSRDARLAAELAAKWEKEDRLEIEQETTCMMCVERCNKSELFKPCSDEKHLWCSKCLHAGFKNALKTKSRLRCCRNIATKSVPSLNPALAKEYNLMLLEMDTANPMYCSAKACGTFIPPPSIKGDIATCTKCQKRSCVHCKAAEHPGKICSQDEDTQRVLRLAEQKKWKQCPGCQNMIEKTEGCLHMTCSRCRGEFCYHCGQLWKKCKNQCSRGYT